MMCQAVAGLLVDEPIDYLGVVTKCVSAISKARFRISVDSTTSLVINRGAGCKGPDGQVIPPGPTADKLPSTSDEPVESQP